MEKESKITKVSQSDIIERQKRISARVCIYTQGPKEPVSSFERILEKELKNKVITAAHVRTLFIANDSVDSWCLHLYTQDNMCISVKDVMAGYAGDGPKDMFTILKMAGFILPEETITNAKSDFLIEKR